MEHVHAREARPDDAPIELRFKPEFARVRGIRCTFLE